MSALPALACQIEHDAREAAIRAEARRLCRADGCGHPERFIAGTNDPAYLDYFAEAAERLGLTAATT